jgi:hypothetical protein
VGHVHQPRTKGGRNSTDTASKFSSESLLSSARDQSAKPYSDSASDHQSTLQVYDPLQIVDLVPAAFQKAGLALLLMLSARVLYRSCAGVPRMPELSALEHQVWGGIVMWALGGGAIEMLAVFMLLFNFFALEERRQKRPTFVKADGPGR